MKGYRDIWDNHVCARCACEWLKDVHTYDVQSWLDSMGKPGTLSRNSLKHFGACEKLPIPANQD